MVWAFSTVLVGWNIFSPLWVNFGIVIHQLMSEEKVLISPFRRSHTAFKLQGTDYLSSGYATLNFNDVESAFVTLFCVLVVNNWFVVVDGFAAVASRDVARVYFLSFYVIGVLLFLNIVVAFILDAFLSEYNKARSSRGW